MKILWLLLPCGTWGVWPAPDKPHKNQYMAIRVRRARYDAPRCGLLEEWISHVRLRIRAEWTISTSQQRISQFRRSGALLHVQNWVYRISKEVFEPMRDS